MAFDVFMNIQGIPGESNDSKHDQWIELLAFSHGVSQHLEGQRSRGAAGAQGRCDHGDFQLTKLLDKASPKLALFCCNGQSIPKIEVELCQAGGDKQTYMKYEMEHVFVTNVAPGGAATGGDARPIESVALNYDKITWTYTQLDPDTNQPKGNTSSWWSTKNNQGG